MLEPAPHETNASCVLGQLVADHPRDNPQLHPQARQCVIIHLVWYIWIFGHTRVSESVPWRHRRLRTTVCLIVCVIIFLEFPVTEFAQRVCVPCLRTSPFFDYQDLSMPFDFGSEAQEHKNQSFFDGHVTLTAHFQEDRRRRSPLKAPTLRFSYWAARGTELRWYSVEQKL